MGFLFSLLGSLPGIIGQYFTVKAQVQLATIQATTAALQGQDALATTIIAMTSNRFKQWLVIIFFSPFIMGIFVPTATIHIFAAMANYPQWYTEECVIVFNTLLGITVGTGFITAMFNHISAFTSLKAGHEIQKLQIRNDLPRD